MIQRKYPVFFKILLPFSMAVILLWAGCTPSVRYARPSAQSRSTYKRPSNNVTKTEIKSEKNIPNEPIISETNNSNEVDNTPAVSIQDNCGLRNTIDKYVGIPYKYGGVDRRGLDCSGLVYRVFKDLGHIDFVRTSSEVMYSMGSSVSKRKMLPGDLVFFKKRGRINHVGIYMGNREFAHSSSTIGVSYTTLDNEYFKNKFVGARRLYRCQ